MFLRHCLKGRTPICLMELCIPTSSIPCLNIAVLPNLCAAAHKCAARAVEVIRGRMSEIKSFQWQVSMKFSTLIENVWFPKFSRGTLLPLHYNIIIWSLKSSSVIIFDDLFRLSLCMVVVLVRWTVMFFPSWPSCSPIADHYNCPTSSLCLCWSWIKYFTTLFLSFCQFNLISKTRYYNFPNLNLWQKLGQRAILPPTVFFDLQTAKKLQSAENWNLSYQRWI